MLVHEVLLLHNLLVLLLDSLIDERKIVEIHLLVLHNEQFELLLHSENLSLSHILLTITPPPPAPPPPIFPSL